ncbi:MAG TPA: hypothetical protein VHW92_09045 [Mycobacteriales bacterium]|jgi:uncharacterized protein YacL|nr:hypothetical protein [Mycobacteriales bacterium]
MIYSRSSRAPRGVIELLRLLTVLFFAEVGFQLGHASAQHGDQQVLGAFGGTALGVIVGSGLGYVIGGMFGRSAAATADRTVVALRDVSADTLVAGGFGAVAGVVVGAGLGWPFFLIPNTIIALPVFAILVLLLGYFGFRVGAAKRDGMLALFGQSAGVGPRRPPPVSVVVDTSVAVDARVLDVVRAGFLHCTMLVIQPVLEELQHLADSAEPNRRARGRRGLELLEALRREPPIDLDVVPDSHPEVRDVDAKLIRVCLDEDHSLLTLDTNLAKVAALAGVQVLNLHSLSLALRPPVVVGEDVVVQLIKPGREAGQGVGYLDDGTMVVVERARGLINKDVTVRVTSVVITANGRLVFGQVAVVPGAVASSGAGA